MDQARNWDEFRDACSYSHMPGENMVWADVDGNIGWQSVGIAPIRPNFSGLVPVPGDGRYEWDGYLPIIEKPNAYNPENGYLVTANENVTPETYDRWDAIGYEWSDPFRGDRIRSVIESSEKVSIDDMMSLQTDYYSIPAKQLVPFLGYVAYDGDYRFTQLCKNNLLRWNYKLEPESILAPMYNEWERVLRAEAKRLYVPKDLQPYITPQLTTIIGWIKNHRNIIGEKIDRDIFIRETFRDAITNITQRLGPDPKKWQYGQEKYKHALIKHPLSDAVSEEWKDYYEVGPLPRGGNAYTPGSTGSNLNQSSGATFRMIIEAGNWDGALGTNAPGQSGDPESPFYDNLFESWANDEYFPVYFSREKIEANKAETVKLIPNK
jgi:penicillin amidase